ncbi:MAG: hypothetical protein FWF36_09220 [Propionibacteriaceae bacterium]|nr:hypothetical protein [Propionibacteriaceae bacterium]
MSMTIPLSEFNRNPSRATRLARIGSLTITDRGLPAFELRSVAQPSNRMDTLVRAGVVTPPRSRSSEPLPDLGVEPAVARAIVDEFEQDKATRDY